MLWQVTTTPGRQLDKDFFKLHGPHCADLSCRGLLYEAHYRSAPQPISTQRRRVRTSLICIVCLKIYETPKHLDGVEKSLGECEDELLRKLDAEYLVWSAKY